MKTPDFLCDAHLHLQDPRLCESQSNCGQTPYRVRTLQVVNGTSEQDWDAVASLAGRPGILPAFGLHPWHIQSRSDKWKPRLEAQLDAHPHALIGEIGLDRWVRYPDYESQKSLFRTQLTIAQERKIPPTLHCLKAWGSMLDLLETLGPWPQGFLLHAFSGPAEAVPKVIALGGYFSLSGYLAHPQKADQLKAWETIPNERILIETDAPNMLPQGPLILRPAWDDHGNPINHPDNLKAVYEWAARWRGLSIEAFASQVGQNVMALFGETRVTTALGPSSR